MPHTTASALEDLTLKILFLSFSYAAYCFFVVVAFFVVFFFVFFIADLHFMLIINVM